MPIYFYSTREEPYGCFSNFSPHGFEFDGIFWKTCEHFFQAQKFAGNAEHVEAVRRAETPKRAATIGRDRKRPLREDWEDVKDGIMYTGVLTKFQTHDQIRDILLSTGDARLVENAPTDYYWGCGQDGSGLNRLGEILMRVRDELRPATD